MNTTDQGVKCLIKSSNPKRAMCLTWSTEASEAESRVQWSPAQAAPSAKKLLTRPFLPLTTSGRGETAAQEPQGERALSSVYFDEEDTGDFRASPWPSSPRATPGRGGEAAAQKPRRERALSSVYFDEEDTGEILPPPWPSVYFEEEETGEIVPPPAAQEPRRERAFSLLSPSLILGDKAKPSHVASKGKRKEEPVEKRKCPRNTCAHSGPAPKDVMEEAAASLAVFVRPAKLSDAEQLIHLNQAFVMRWHSGRRPSPCHRASLAARARARARARASTHATPS